MGSWTRALQKQEGDNLAVHVDGFYGGAPSCTLAAMKTAGGFRRVVLFAGGSGVTSFTALLQVTVSHDGVGGLKCLVAVVVPGKGFVWGNRECFLTVGIVVGPRVEHCGPSL